MTAATVEPVVEFSGLELIELEEEWAIPCEVAKPKGCGGDRAAVWIAYGVNCCPTPKQFFYCDPCKTMLLSNPGGLLCGYCDFHHVPASAAFRLIEPLNQR